MDEKVDAWIEWLRQLRTTVASYPEPSGGVLSYVDADSRRRGAAAVRDGTSVNLARPLDATSPAASSKFRLRTSVEVRDRLTVGFDSLEVTQHGIAHTHLDAWSHYGVDGTFFADRPVDHPELASVEHWADRGVVTRAVLLDVPEVRGTAWVEPQAPVTGAELDQALAAAGGDLRPGDAVLIYQGRDRFEQAGHAYRTTPESMAAGEPRPGLGRSAAEWIAQQRVSVVCWDFLDALHDAEPRACVHLLIWAVGLGLVDNCDLGSARDALRAASKHDGMLVLAPLRIRSGTASLVSPLLVF